MKIGRIIIKRSSTIRKALVDFRELRFKRFDWHRTLGIYQSRIFGLCIYHDEADVKKVLEEILNDPAGPQGNDH